MSAGTSVVDRSAIKHQAESVCVTTWNFLACLKDLLHGPTKIISSSKYPNRMQVTIRIHHGTYKTRRAQSGNRWLRVLRVSAVNLN